MNHMIACENYSLELPSRSFEFKFHACAHDPCIQNYLMYDHASILRVSGFDIVRPALLSDCANVRPSMLILYTYEYVQLHKVDT